MGFCEKDGLTILSDFLTQEKLNNFAKHHSVYAVFVNLFIQELILQIEKNLRELREFFHKIST